MQLSKGVLSGAPPKYSETVGTMDEATQHTFEVKDTIAEKITVSVDTVRIYSLQADVLALVTRTE
jgi:hypothetical protein